MHDTQIIATGASDAPRVRPILDPSFQPIVLARQAMARRLRASRDALPVTLAIEQPSGYVYRRDAAVYPDGHSDRREAYRSCMRLLKSMLWSRGGCRIHVDGPFGLVDALRRHFASEPTGVFDARIAEQIYGHPLEIVRTAREALPSSSETEVTLGGHWNGCRIGFDLGASDRKVAAAIDGQIVFSEEVAWDPASHSDPQWHFIEIMDSLRSAASHLPRVDAIGGSSAGVYLDNEVRVSSLFRAVAADAFEHRVRGLFGEIARAWGDVPLVVVNDGDVTALAGSMLAGAGALLGIAMGSSQAAGYVAPNGYLTSWLNELAFAPVDEAPNAPVDEWSGDRGCGVQYLSQQATGRLMPAAGIPVDPETTLPERLVLLQELMAARNDRAASVYATVGVYLGYALLEYIDLYQIENVLVLGRVMTGRGGDVIMERAQDVLRVEQPEVLRAITFRTVSERDRRHGQAIAAASLPALD